MLTKMEALQAAMIACNSLEECSEYLDHTNHLFYGIEAFSPEGISATCEYVNTGQTYEPTILRVDGLLSIGSWGDWVESVESQHCEENGAIRCAYCGQFTPMPVEWRKVVCEYCGNFVDGVETCKSY